MPETSPPESSPKRIIAGGLFALFCAFIIAALAVFGVISMALGHIFMAAAALVGGLVIWTELIPSKPPKHKLLATLLLCCLLGGADYLIVRHKNAEAASTPVAASSPTQEPAVSPSSTPPSAAHPEPKDAPARDRKVPSKPSTQAVPPSVTNNCPNGICISGGTVEHPEVHNNYGQPPLEITASAQTQQRINSPRFAYATVFTISANVPAQLGDFRFTCTAPVVSGMVDRINPHEWIVGKVMPDPNDDHTLIYPVKAEPVDPGQNITVRIYSQTPLRVVSGNSGSHPITFVEPHSATAPPPIINAPGGVVSSGQHGGITAGTVNIFPPTPAQVPTVVSFTQDGNAVTLSTNNRIESPSLMLLFDSDVSLASGPVGSINTGDGQGNGPDGRPDAKTIWLFWEFPPFTPDRPITVKFSSSNPATLLRVVKGPPSPMRR